MPWAIELMKIATICLDLFVKKACNFPCVKWNRTVAVKATASILTEFLIRKSTWPGPWHPFITLKGVVDKRTDLPGEGVIK